jgi:hypothetical protein
MLNDLGGQSHSNYPSKNSSAVFVKKAFDRDSKRPIDHSGWISEGTTMMTDERYGSDITF